MKDLYNITGITDEMRPGDIVELITLQRARAANTDPNKYIFDDWNLDVGIPAMCVAIMDFRHPISTQLAKEDEWVLCMYRGNLGWFYRRNMRLYRRGVPVT